MREVPPGVEFHKGLDGLLVGGTIVFLVRLEMVISSLLNWRIIPAWSYEPIQSVRTGIASGVISGISPVFGNIQLSGPGSNLPSILTLIPESASLLVSGATVITGIPLLLMGTESTIFLRQLFIVIGFWIAVLVPLWAWVLQPVLFWWRDRTES